jgi:hypothetical protein
MRSKLLIVCLLSMLSASCQSGPRADVWCATNDPHRPSKAEIAAMSDARVKQVLAHNRLGQKRCQWKP